MASIFVAASAIVIACLGLVHLLFTFSGAKLHPRDLSLKDAMMASSPVISRETTMWRAWIGFNASHSFGAMLFGIIYGYLAILHGEFLMQSTFLLAVGFCLLSGYALLGKVYWFSVPFRSILLALFLYGIGLGLHFA
ncbi:MAG: hypothetical protein Q7T44_07720 [Parvibaculum sp.]|nr:hypothetical protein [Parvibaculum sp.]